jgi:hypothetical protein
MGIRLPLWAAGVLAVALVGLMSNPSWAVYYELSPSKDEWKLKYDVEITAADAKTLNVVVTLADEGRLKPIHSITVVAFSRQTDSQGGRSYDVKAPIEFKTTAEGTRAGQVQIRKEFADRALIRVLTLTVDGRRQTAGAAYYDIPLKKFLNKVPTTASSPKSPSFATPPTPNVIK